MCEREENQSKGYEENIIFHEKEPFLKSAENLKSSTEEISIEKKLMVNVRKEKLLSFFKKNGGIVFAPLFTLIIYLIQLAVCSVFPFGKDYVVASYDLSAQICPYIEHLFDVMDGKSSLFYSYAVAGGSDVFGTFAYFFISPFSFIFLLFGNGNVYNACGIVMAAKLATIAFSGAWLIRKQFKNIPTYVGAAMGVVYAYCGYTFVANTYINWMDFLIYMPYLTVAFLHFLKTNKFWIFSALMACCIYTCFSIACFSMFTVFPALVLYGVFCVKEGRKEYIARLCFSFLGAILMALPVLMPALYAYLRGARGGGLFEDFWFGYAGEGFSSFDRKSFFDRSGEALYRKWSYILSDSIFVVLTLAYFIRSRVKTPLSKFMLCAGILTLIPVFFDESMLLLNMGSYMSYALRFGFLNAFYFFGGSCLFLNEGIFQKETIQIGRKREKSTIFYSLLCLMAAGALTAFFASDAYLNIFDSLTSSSGLISNFHGFSSMFAHSLGGLQVIAIVFVLVGIVAAVGILMVKHQKISARIATLLLIGVVGVQVICYNEQLVVGNRSTHYNIDHYKTMTRIIGENDKEYYRIKDYEDKLTSVIPLTAGTNSYSSFSSMIDRDSFAVATLFGYKGNGKNSLKSAGGTFFGDCFLGYKYYFLSSEKKSEADKLSYLQAVSTGSDNENSVLNSGSFYMYENTAVYPLGYRVQATEGFKFIYENTTENRVANRAALYNYLYGEKVVSEGSGVSENMAKKLGARLLERAASVEVGKSEITASLSASEGDLLFLPFVASKGYRVKVNGKTEELIENDLNFLCVKLEIGENKVSFEYHSPYKKWIVAGMIGGAAGLTALAFIIDKTKFIQRSAGVLEYAGIIVAAACVGFFFIYPIAVGLLKLGTALWQVIF